MEFHWFETTEMFGGETEEENVLYVHSIREHEMLIKRRKLNECIEVVSVQTCGLPYGKRRLRKWAKFNCLMFI